MKKQIIISVIAAILFLAGLAAMLFLNTFRLDLPSADTTLPFYTAKPGTSAPPVTQPPTQPPTDPPTEPPTTAPPPTTVPPPDTWDPEDIGLEAEYAFVYSTARGRVLYEGGDQQAHVAPASITKLLTAYVALQYLELDQVITVGNEITLIDPFSSVANILYGHRLTTEMLIQGLLMQSGNDAAYTLAVAAGRAIAGNNNLSIDSALSTFMKKMNETAKELGMQNTHFLTPDGNDKSGHYTTMEDLLILSQVTMDNPIIMRYCGMAEANVTFVSGQTRKWTNSNYLLSTKHGFYTAACIGLKTGTTSKAGKCLISAFDEGDDILIIGVLSCPTDDGRYEDTLYLYEKYR